MPTMTFALIAQCAARPSYYHIKQHIKLSLFIIEVCQICINPIVFVVLTPLTFTGLYLINDVHLRQNLLERL